LKAVEWSDKNKSRDWPPAGDINGNSAAQTAPDDIDVRMLGVHVVKKGQGIFKEGLFGRTAGTTTIATVMQQVDRSIGKSNRKTRHVERDVLRVAPEIGLSAGIRENIQISTIQ
jgi:hypothetical protein